MAGIITGGADIQYDKLSVFPLGGQGEIGQVLWVVSYGGELLLVDAGASYPGEDLPGVDLLLPNTNFLEANQERILALLLTNGHEEHSGAVGYLLNHLKIPRILAPRFVSTLVSQKLMDRGSDTTIDTIEMRHPYQIGPFEVEWMQVNDAIADACALKIETPEGRIVYTSSFKLDQTPVDSKLPDVARLAQIGDQGVLLLLSDSAGVETRGYTPSEKSVTTNLSKHISSASGRVVVVIPGTNTHRLQILFDLASRLDRKVVLVGETLIKAALVAVITGNLVYDRKIEASLEDINELPDDRVLIVATGQEGDPMDMMHELVDGAHREVTLKTGDTVIYSADIYPGRSRQMANILDQFLSLGVKYIVGSRDGVHVSKHASREELKLMLSICNPRFFVPAIGEGRHIRKHAHLAIEWGIPPECAFPLQNGEILEIGGGVASIIGTIESQAVMYNRDQGERVTTFSVKERKNLSLDGVLTIGLAVDDKLNLLSGPVLEANASGFLQSSEWLAVREELLEAVVETLKSQRGTNGHDLNAVRTSIREMAGKMIRAKLQAKPLIQVVLHEVITSRPV
jgi:ribonuclease J